MAEITIDKPEKKRVGARTGKRLGNLPTTACRWTISKAASEFQMDDKTITKRLRELNYPPGPDSCWSTMQMCTCKYGDLQLERARKTRADANIAEMEEGQLNGRLIPVENIMKRLADGAVAIKNYIMASSLTQKEKMELLNEIADYFDDKRAANSGELAED